LSGSPSTSRTAWRTGLQIQRAADAGSLAGVVYLPGDVTTGRQYAIAEVADNGYTANTTTTVTAAPNPANNRQLNVTVTAQVPTFFIRIFGINSWTITRQSRAAFVMPVPMGSPLAYYGVGCLILTGSTPACNSNGTGASGVTTLGTSGGTPLSSLGAWGAVITKGGYESNGDAYSPANNNDQSWTVNTTTNVSYDLNGYYYTAVLPAGAASRSSIRGSARWAATAPAGTWAPATTGLRAPATPSPRTTRCGTPTTFLSIRVAGPRRATPRGRHSRTRRATTRPTSAPAGPRAAPRRVATATASTPTTTSGGRSPAHYPRDV